MCTAFPYVWISVQRLLEVIHAIIFTGGFMAGPRALRPERLRWLTTSAVNRQVFRPEPPGSEPCRTRRQSHCDTPGQLHAGSGHRAIWSSGRSAMRTQDAAFLRLPHRHPGDSRGLLQVPAFAGMTGRKDNRALALLLFSKILTGPKPGGSNTLHLPANGKAGFI